MSQTLQTQKNLRDKFNWLLFVKDRLFKTLPWLLFISIFYDSPWSIFTAIEQIKNDQSDQALFGINLALMSLNLPYMKLSTAESIKPGFIPVVISFSKKLWSWVWTMAFIFSASVECKCFTVGNFFVNYFTVYFRYQWFHRLAPITGLKASLIP